MYKINEIKELIRTLDKSSITELTIRNENKEQVTIKKGGYVVTSEQLVTEVTPAPVAATPVQAPVAAPAPAQDAAPTVVQADDADLHKVVSPMVGTFYASQSPETPAYVKVGDQVTDESVVCIVEAMKLMNELEAEVSGEIVKILVENGQLVEYGQPLFLVKLA